MLFKFGNNEISIGRCLWGWRWKPKICYCNTADTEISWLGGCIVWSRLKRTHKNTDGVQKD